MATALLDLWQRLLKSLAGIPPTNWALVGRWCHEAFRGRPFPGVVSGLPARAGELPLGWTFHYLVGLGYGAVYIIGLRDWVGIAPSLLNGAVLGGLSVVVPWFFFMPAMGAGVLARNAPNPALARRLALAAHIVFGTGLALGSHLGSSAAGA